MRIIHFSDFHLEGDKNKLCRAASIVNYMINALKDINREKKIDLILFSGDLIDKGGKSFARPKMQNGFKAFQDKVIEPILGALKLPHNRFIFTIGNHDVDTKHIKKREERRLVRELTDLQALDIYMHKSPLNIPRISEYVKFRDEYWDKNKGDAIIDTSDDTARLFQHSIRIEIEGKQVGINCLNTAWRCYDSKTDANKILVGKSQICDPESFFEGCHIKIAIGHHHPSLMNSFDADSLKELIPQKYNMFFCGHTHDNDAMCYRSPCGECYYFNTSGTTRENVSAAQKYRNGFKVVDYEIDDGYIESQCYYQDTGETFVRDENYGKNGVWHEEIVESNIIRPMKQTLLSHKRTTKFLHNAVIDDYMQKLADSKNDTIRMVALSGLGKTRILQEAFDDGQDHNNYYYSDYSDSNILKNEIKKILLRHTEQDGLIVLDNCPNPLLDLAIDCRNMYNPRFRIIGVNNEYYDLGDFDRRKTIMTILLNPDQIRDLANKYIDENVLTENGGDSIVKDAIKKIADGFPGMAIELVEEFKKEKNVSADTVNHIVKKLFKFEEGKESEQEIILRSLSLFNPCPYDKEQKEAYNFICNSELITPLPYISKESRRRAFTRTINSYKSYQIEISGSWLNVRPFPLAVWLVREWFKGVDKECMGGIVKEIESLEKPTYDVVKEGLYNRLKYMQDSVPAKELFSRLMKINSGPFCSEKVVCSDLGSRLFLAISSVNPVAVASCLYNILMPKTIEWVKETIRDNVRRNLVNALEKLCFDAESYDYGSKVMALLAVAENETWANNATGQFVQLFHIMLPGTQTSLEERIKTLQYLRGQGEPYGALTLRCLDNAFAYGYFVRDGENAQFGLEHKTDYKPQNNEIVNYWESCRDMLMEWLGEDTSILEGVKEIVVNHVLNWDSIGMLEQMFPLVEKVCDTDGGKWEELYTTLNNIEERYWAMRSDGFVTRLEALKEQIRPRTFNQRLIDARQVFYKRRSNSRDDSGEDLFRPLAKAFLEEKIYLSVEEVSEIAGTEQYHDIWFSPALAEIVSDSQLKELMGVFLSVIEQNGENNFKGGFVFRVCYQFRDKGIVRNFIRQIFDDGYYDLYVRLLSTCETDSFVSYNQIKEHINKGELDTTYVGVYLQRASLFEWNQISSVIKMFRKDYISEVTKLGDFIISHRYDRGLRKDSEIKVIAKDVMLDYPLTDDRGNNNWEFTQLVKSILENEHDENFARGLNKKLIKFLGNGYAHGNFEGIYNLLLTNYADAIWGDFEKAFVDDEYCLFRFNVKDELGSGLGFGEGTLFKTNGDKVKKMCEKYPDNAPCNISEMIPVFDSDENGIRFSDWFMWLLDNYADRTGVLSGLDANLNTFSWTGSVIPLLNDKKTCLERIANHKNAKVRKWVDSHLNDVNEQLEKEMDEEAYGRFSHS